MKTLRLSSIVLLAVCVLAFSACAGSAKPLPESLALAPASSSVADRGSFLAFVPQAPASLGFIFYPGAKVDPRAYAPLLSALADDGYLVLMPKMPFDLAIFGVGKAAALMKAHPEIKRWAIGGHSLGGVAAAMFAKRKNSGLSGIAFIASYPDRGSDLSASGLSGLCLSASRDGLSTKAKIDAATPLFPADTSFRVIEGGNHAQFGWYGPQKGDGLAAINREDQQRIAHEILADWLSRLASP
jgi:pimeloyl-ACP methyl ester carboxylesterase